MPRTLPVRRQWLRMWLPMNWVQRPTQSKPRARLRLTVRLKKLAALSANGNAHNFQVESVN